MSSPPSDAISAALEALLARCVRMVRSVGARHGLSDADVDDVVQDVRIRLWRSCTTTEQIERLGASYVYRAATTAALDLLRRRRAHGAAVTDSVDEHSEQLAARSSASDATDAHDLERQVLAALDALPLSRRTVVRMYLSGYEREEIAELLGWTEPTPTASPTSTSVHQCKARDGSCSATVPNGSPTPGRFARAVATCPGGTTLLVERMP